MGALVTSQEVSRAVGDKGQQGTQQSTGRVEEAARAEAGGKAGAGPRTAPGSSFISTPLPWAAENNTPVSDLRSEPWALKLHHLVNLFFWPNRIYASIFHYFQKEMGHKT